MRNILIVAQREYLERVRSKAFILTTILIPVLFAAIYAGPLLLKSGGGERTLALVNDGPPEVGEHVAAALSVPPTDEEGMRYRVERVEGPLASVRAELTRRVQDKEIDGYVAIPADVVESSQIAYRARDISNMQVVRDIQRAASEAVQGVRLREAGLEVTEVASLVRPVRAQTTRITEEGETGGSALSTFLFAYIALFLGFFVILMYGSAVLMSVLEEKTSRISEVIVSSMRAGELMAGKIVGVGGVAVSQLAIWLALAAVALTQSSALLGMLGIDAGAAQIPSIPAGTVALLVAFFLLGFLMYAAIFAAVAASTNSMEEAQQLLPVAQIPLFIPMMFAFKVGEDPLGTAATVLGLIPLTAPMTMPMRLVATTLPAWQIAASLASVALGAALVAWIAGKIYRVGILSTGKKPTLRELGQWLRTA